MSHEVHTMAYVGATPWHGLGRLLDPDQPLASWQDAAGMAWQIEASPVRFFNGSQTLHSFPEQLVLHRSDTHAPLAVVSQRFQVVQPQEILEFYRDLTEVSGFALETAGVLKGGKKFWALARTGQDAQLKGGDRVRGYLLLATACDGTLATTAQFTSVRVVCNNTLQVALGDGTSVVKVSHRARFDAEAVKRQLGVAVSSWDSFLHWIRAFAERRLTPAQAEVMVKRALEASGTLAIDKTAQQVLALYQGEGKGAHLPSAQGTAWGLVNAITEHVDFHKRARSVDSRLDSAWFGQGAQVKQAMFSEAMRAVATV